MHLRGNFKQIIGSLMQDSVIAVCLARVLQKALESQILVEEGETERLFAAAPCFGADNPPVIKARCLSPVLLRISECAFLSFPLICSFLYFITLTAKKSPSSCPAGIFAT